MRACIGQQRRDDVVAGPVQQYCVESILFLQDALDVAVLVGLREISHCNFEPADLRIGRVDESKRCGLS